MKKALVCSDCSSCGVCSCHRGCGSGEKGAGASGRKVSGKVTVYIAANQTDKSAPLARSL